MDVWTPKLKKVATMGFLINDRLYSFQRDYKTWFVRVPSMAKYNSARDSTWQGVISPIRNRTCQYNHHSPALWKLKIKRYWPHWWPHMVFEVSTPSPIFGVSSPCEFTGHWSQSLMNNLKRWSWVASAMAVPTRSGRWWPQLEQRWHTSR